MQTVETKEACPLDLCDGSGIRRYDFGQDGQRDAKCECRKEVEADNRD